MSEKFEAAKKKLRFAESDFKNELQDRMKLKARVDDCVTYRCDPIWSQAKEMAKRLGLDKTVRVKPTAQDEINDP